MGRSLGEVLILILSLGDEDSGVTGRSITKSGAPTAGVPFPKDDQGDRGKLVSFSSELLEDKEVSEEGREGERQAESTLPTLEEANSAVPPPQGSERLAHMRLGASPSLILEELIG